eukprot:1181395-Prorocentrum_minimum.AAC.9
MIASHIAPPERGLPPAPSRCIVTLALLETVPYTVRLTVPHGARQAGAAGAARAVGGGGGGGQRRRGGGQDHRGAAAQRVHPGGPGHPQAVLHLRALQAHRARVHHALHPQARAARDRHLELNLERRGGGGLGGASPEPGGRSDSFLSLQAKALEQCLRHLLLGGGMTVRRCLYYKFIKRGFTRAAACRWGCAAVGDVVESTGGDVHRGLR